MKPTAELSRTGNTTLQPPACCRQAPSLQPMGHIIARHKSQASSTVIRMKNAFCGWAAGQRPRSFSLSLRREDKRSGYPMSQRLFSHIVSDNVRGVFSPIEMKRWLQRFFCISPFMSCFDKLLRLSVKSLLSWACCSEIPGTSWWGKLIDVSSPLFEQQVNSGTKYFPGLGTSRQAHSHGPQHF